jgi:hypothetical protein
VRISLGTRQPVRHAKVIGPWKASGKCPRTASKSAHSKNPVRTFRTVIWGKGGHTALLR